VSRTALRLGILILIVTLPCWCAPQSAQSVAAGSPPPAQAPAQTSAPAGRRLNLAAALDLAERQNLDLAAARLLHSVAQAGTRIAGQIPNPGVSFSATRDTPHENLLLDQPFEIGGQRGRRIDVAKQQVVLTDVGIHAVQTDVRLRTREAFYAAALAHSRTAQLREVLGLAQRLQEIAKTRFDAGDVPQLEVLQADLQVSQAQANVEVASQQENVAFSALNELLNEPAETPWDLSGSLDVLPLEIPLAELTRRAEGANADLQNLAQQVKVEQSRRVLLRAERIPNLDVSAGTSLDKPPDFRAALIGGVSLTLPVFSRNQGEIAQSEASERVLDATLLAMRRAVNGRVEEAFYTVSAQQTQVNLYRTTVLPSGRQVESLAEDSYRAGKASLLSVLDAQRNVQQIERDYLDSLFSLQSAFAQLEQIVGESLD
jgi:cobalt-zinc-cadmium efflux system outer membrane protein